MERKEDYLGVEEAERVRKWFRIRVDTLIWLVLALALFGISARMTYTITKVENTPDQSGLAVTFINRGAAPQRLPRVSFAVQGGALALTIDGIASSITDIRLGTFPRSAETGVACDTINRTNNDSWDTATDDESPMVAANPTKAVPRTFVLHLGGLKASLPKPTAQSLESNVNTEMDLAAIMSGEKPTHLKMNAADLERERKMLMTELTHTDTATCSLPIGFAHDTFTSRSFDVPVSEQLPDSKGNQTSVFPKQVSVTDKDAQEIHVTNVASGVTLLASSITGPFPGYDDTSVHHAVTLHFQWESISADSYRDIYITLIGTLIALGAAGLIEACRPYVEVLVMRSQK
jgi:hypothetical protein